MFGPYTKRSKYKRLRKNVLISGSARSGTTWLGEVLNKNRLFKVVFEPFSTGQNPHWAIVKQQKIYLRKTDEFQHHDLALDILSGKLDYNWSGLGGRNRKTARRTMIKDIRVSAMLSWMHHNFPELKIVYIVRDPYSVAYSCAERGWGDRIVKLYLRQTRLVKDHFSQNQTDLLKKAEGLFQKNLAMWAIENYLTLKTMRENPNVTSVYYENIVRRPSTEIKRLTNFANIPFDDAMVTTMKSKSKTAGKNSVTNVKSKDFGMRWAKSITDADKEYAEQVLQAFGLDSLYKSRNMPAFGQPFEMSVE